MERRNKKLNQIKKKEKINFLIFCCCLKNWGRPAAKASTHKRSEREREYVYIYQKRGKAGMKNTITDIMYIVCFAIFKKKKMIRREELEYKSFLFCFSRIEREKSGGKIALGCCCCCCWIGPICSNDKSVLLLRDQLVFFFKSDTQNGCRRRNGARCV
jgi:hypothetical protein